PLAPLFQALEKLTAFGFGNDEFAGIEFPNLASDKGAAEILDHILASNPSLADPDLVLVLLLVLDSHPEMIFLDVIAHLSALVVRCAYQQLNFIQVALRNL